MRIGLSPVRLLVVCFGCLLALPGTARGQWYGAFYAGGNVNKNADVSIRQPANGTALTFHDVSFAAQPFTPRRYYGIRLGRAFHAHRLGFELEFIHMKVIARTDRVVEVSGRYSVAESLASGVSIRMDEIVERYSMTHGLNVLLVNVAMGRRLGDRASVAGRLGAGPMVPHAESTVAGRWTSQYEYGGIGVGGAAGVEVRIKGPVFAVAEYKLTYGRPKITIADGTGVTTAVAQHVAVGLAVALPE